MGKSGLMSFEEIARRLEEVSKELQERWECASDLTKEQADLWRSLGGTFGHYGEPQDAHGCTFQQAFLWWEMGGEAKHKEHDEFMRKKMQHVCYKLNGKDTAWHFHIRRALENRWILKADASLL